MRAPRPLLAIVSICFALSLHADGLVKLKDWATTPQSYFMTKAERQQWETIHSDDEAQKFVDAYLARRGPGFLDEVNARAEQADKHLTIGKTPGSKSLRGKLIVLFGPPSAMTVDDVAEDAAVHRDSPMMANVLAGGTNSGTADGGRGADSAPDNLGKTQISSGRITRKYQFTFDKTPAGKLTANVSADISSGVDRPRTKDDAKAIETANEAAAQASIKVK